MVSGGVVEKFLNLPVESGSQAARARSQRSCASKNRRPGKQVERKPAAATPASTTDRTLASSRKPQCQLSRGAQFAPQVGSMSIESGRRHAKRSKSRRSFQPCSVAREKAALFLPPRNPWPTSSPGRMPLEMETQRPPPSCGFDLLGLRQRREQRLRLGDLRHFRRRRKAFERGREDGVGVRGAAGRLVELGERVRRAQSPSARALFFCYGEGGLEGFLGWGGICGIALEQDFAAHEIQRIRLNCCEAFSSPARAPTPRRCIASALSSLFDRNSSLGLQRLGRTNCRRSPSSAAAQSSARVRPAGRRVAAADPAPRRQTLSAVARQCVLPCSRPRIPEPRRQPARRGRRARTRSRIWPESGWAIDASVAEHTCGPRPASRMQLDQRSRARSTSPNCHDTSPSQDIAIKPVSSLKRCAAPRSRSGSNRCERTLAMDPASRNSPSNKPDYGESRGSQLQLPRSGRVPPPSRRKAQASPRADLQLASDVAPRSTKSVGRQQNARKSRQSSPRFGRRRAKAAFVSSAAKPLAIIIA